MTQPTISVLTPNYNHGRFLPRMIESIIEQDYPNWEAVIVDDGSSDDSVEVIRRYQRDFPQIKLLENGRNLGILASQQRALREVTGKYILFRGADDFCYPDFFREASALLETNVQAALCCGDLAFVDDTGCESRVERHGFAREPGYIAPENLAKVMGPCNSFYSHATIIRSEIVRAVDCFDPDMMWLWDFFWYYTFAFRHGICYIPRPVSGARFDASSYSNTRADVPGALKQVLATIIKMLTTEHRDVLPCWMKSGMLNIFPEAMVEVVMETPAFWTPEVLLLIQRPMHERLKVIEAVERTFDLGGQLKRQLVNRRDVLLDYLACTPNRRIAVYGLGSHTRQLTRVWRELGLPALHCFLVSEPTDRASLDGLPVHVVSDVPKDEVDLVLISSRSFESAMVNACRHHLPGTPLFCFWNPLLGDILNVRR
jgi:glycosyltransferase involved in cell wall biosynthesis